MTENWKAEWRRIRARPLPKRFGVGGAYAMVAGRSLAALPPFPAPPESLFPLELAAPRPRLPKTKHGDRRFKAALTLLEAAELEHHGRLGAFPRSLGIGPSQSPRHHPTLAEARARRRDQYPGALAMPTAVRRWPAREAQCCCPIGAWWIRTVTPP